MGAVGAASTVVLFAGVHAQCKRVVLDRVAEGSQTFGPFFECCRVFGAQKVYRCYILGSMSSSSSSSSACRIEWGRR